MANGCSDAIVHSVSAMEKVDERALPPTLNRNGNPKRDRRPCARGDHRRIRERSTQTP